ncbi:hypothetical protein KCP69_09070 [Salmonella enterica subsp. enterica]|nr:hypothetical protein KCP69_09070 [Salmonella enterica subsp. enterica]
MGIPKTGETIVDYLIKPFNRASYFALAATLKTAAILQFGSAACHKSAILPYTLADSRLNLTRQTPRGSVERVWPVRFVLNATTKTTQLMTREPYFPPECGREAQTPAIQRRPPGRKRQN